MKKKYFIFGLIIISLLFVLTTKNSPSALHIETSPPSQVYIDGKEEGTTPLTIESKKKDSTVLLVPQSSDTSYSSYETKVDLIPGVKTVLRHIFSENPSQALTQIASYQKTHSKRPAITITSAPDGAQVFIDGTYQGVTPIKIYKDKEDIYTVAIQSPDYVQNQLKLQTANGYNTTLFVALSSAQVPGTSLEK